MTTLVGSLPAYIKAEHVQLYTRLQSQLQPTVTKWAAHAAQEFLMVLPEVTDDAWLSRIIAIAAQQPLLDRVGVAGQPTATGPSIGPGTAHGHPPAFVVVSRSATLTTEHPRAIPGTGVFAVGVIGRAPPGSAERSVVVVALVVVVVVVVVALVVVALVVVVGQRLVERAEVDDGAVGVDDARVLEDVRERLAPAHLRDRGRDLAGVAEAAAGAVAGHRIADLFARCQANADWPFRLAAAGFDDHGWSNGLRAAADIEELGAFGEPDDWAGQRARLGRQAAETRPKAACGP